MQFRIYETFKKKADKTFTDNEFSELTQYLADYPTKGDVIKGSGGFRKLRWAYGNKGKSGGARVIYYYITADDIIHLVMLYTKNEQDNLSAAAINKLRELKDTL